MKGVIPICLSELVKKRFGSEKWVQILEKAGLQKSEYFLPQQNVDDRAALKVFAATCSVLDLSAVSAAEAFGEYWCCEYAPRIYAAYFTGVRNARDFLLRNVHEQVTKTIPDAHPPAFSFEEPSRNKLIMKYSSQRGLGDIFAGLVKGVVRHFREELQIRRISPTAVEITFAN